MDSNKKDIKAVTAVKAAVILLVILTVILIYFVKNNDNTQDNSELTADELNLPRLVDLGSDSCPGCIKLKPEIEDLKEFYSGRIAVQTVDVYNDIAEMEKYYAIQAFKQIPTLMLLDKDMNLLWSHTGYMEKEEIKKIIKEKTGIE